MKKRSGFTLIEIAIFLAITGLLFIGIAAGTSNSVMQQRFTDSVQNFAEFFRTVYSGVANPQGLGTEGGRSNKAIYGKLVVFGENYGLDGEENKDNRVFVYDVVGDVSGDVGSGNLVQSLYNLGANVIYKNESNEITFAGMVESYLPKWAAEIESVSSTDTIKAAVLVVRHPRSGTISTLVYEDTIEVNDALKQSQLSPSQTVANPLAAPLKDGLFKSSDIDFCVNPYGEDNGIRQDVRIIKNAHNATGVEIIPLDDEDNRCKG